MGFLLKSSFVRYNNILRDTITLDFDFVHCIVEHAVVTCNFGLLCCIGTPPDRP